MNLSSIASMDMTEKKGYLTISLTVHKDSNILLRSTTAIQELFHVITVGDSNIIKLNKEPSSSVEML